MTRKPKKPVHHVEMTEGKREIIRGLLEEYDIESAQDIQDALKDLLGGTIKEMMEAEMDEHIGYEKSERANSDDFERNYRNTDIRINESIQATAVCPSTFHRTAISLLNLRS